MTYTGTFDVLRVVRGRIVARAASIVPGWDFLSGGEEAAGDIPIRGERKNAREASKIKVSQYLREYPEGIPALCPGRDSGSHEGGTGRAEDESLPNPISSSQVQQLDILLAEDADTCFLHV